MRRLLHLPNLFHKLKHYAQYTGMVVSILVLAACGTMGQSGSSSSATPAISLNQVINDWSNETLFQMKRIQGTPTNDARWLGYIGLTMYETTRYSNSHYQSIAPQLSNASTLEIPQPIADAQYNWALVVNAGQANIMQHFLEQELRGDDDNPIKVYRKARVNQLAQKISSQIQGVAPDVAERSTALGNAVADAIFAWSQTDHPEEDLRTRFDYSYTAPKTGKGAWEPPDSGSSQVPGADGPLYPRWGEHRLFVPTNAQLATPEILPYSEEPSSAYYLEFKTVYDKSQTLTDEELAIAAWWSDDPSKYYSPPAHSYYLATKVVALQQPDAVKAAQTYAAVGLAVADAFTNCWKVKFKYYSERPGSYIRRVIDPAWYPIWPEPPFPAFVSGHGIQTGAATTVLANLYGDKMTFTDDTYLNRDDDLMYDRKTEKYRIVVYSPRQYQSFSQLAEEVAISRLYGGIHSPQDNIEGLKMGRMMGTNVSDLVWKKP